MLVYQRVVEHLFVVEGCFPDFFNHRRPVLGRSFHPPWCNKSSLVGSPYVISLYGNPLNPQATSYKCWKLCNHFFIFFQESNITRWWQLKYLFMFIPIPGEMIQFDEHMFQMGWFNHHLDNKS